MGASLRHIYNHAGYQFNMHDTSTSTQHVLYQYHWEELKEFVKGVNACT